MGERPRLLLLLVLGSDGFAMFCQFPLAGTYCWSLKIIRCICKGLSKSLLVRVVTRGTHEPWLSSWWTLSLKAALLQCQHSLDVAIALPKAVVLILSRGSAMPRIHFYRLTNCHRRLHWGAW